MTALGRVPLTIGVGVEGRVALRTDLIVLAQHFDFRRLLGGYFLQMPFLPEQSSPQSAHGNRKKSQIFRRRSEESRISCS